METTEKKQKPDTIYIDDFGRYRWTYQLVGSENHSYRNTLLLIFALVILIPGVIMFFMLYGRDIFGFRAFGAPLGRPYWSDGAAQYLLILLAVFAGVELLTVLIYNLFDKTRGGSKPMPYAMEEKGIRIYPEDRLTPPSYLYTFFSSVTDIKVKPEYDEIDLLELMRVTQVYVYPEDRPFVLNYFFDHVKPSKKIEQRRTEYQKYL